MSKNNEENVEIVSSNEEKGSTDIRDFKSFLVLLVILLLLLYLALKYILDSHLY